MEEYIKSRYNFKGMTDKLPKPKTIHLPANIDLDVDLIKKLISENEDQVFRTFILQEYYNGYAPILDRKLSDPDKPNNRLVAPFPAYISDMLTGMFIGQPVTYHVSKEYENNFADVQSIFNYNDIQDEDHELALENSKVGRSYEIVYVDHNKDIRINKLDGKNVVYAYTNHINPEPLLAIHYSGSGDNFVCRVYERDRIRIYETSKYTLVYDEPNIIGKLPIIESSNNNEKMGDFERVLSNIDAYNKAQSDTANDFEEFTDAILVLKGMLDADDEEIAEAKRQRVLLLSALDGQGAEWLTKTMDTTALENYKTRLYEDIHSFSYVPNLNDDKFGGNSSGVALKYKLLALRQAIAAKERKFKRFLQDRLELVIAYMRVLGHSVDMEHTDVDITFNVNIPIDEKENVETVKELMGMVSEKTALSQLYFVEDVNKEIEMKNEELDPYMLVGDEVEEELQEDREEVEEVNK